MAEEKKEKTNPIPRIIVDRILTSISEVMNLHTSNWTAAGSYRRGKDPVGDIDIIGADIDLRNLVADLFRYEHKTNLQISLIIRLGSQIGTMECIWHGEGYEILNDDPIQIEFDSVRSSSFGAALLHFTGSAAFNQTLRAQAKQKGWLVSQHGVFTRKAVKVLEGTTEEQIFTHLELPFIEPRLRNQDLSSALKEVNGVVSENAMNMDLSVALMGEADKREGYRAAAYKKIAFLVSKLERPINEIAWQNIPGIGPSINSFISTWLFLNLNRYRPQERLF